MYAPLGCRLGNEARPARVSASRSRNWCARTLRTPRAAVQRPVTIGQSGPLEPPAAVNTAVTTKRKGKKCAPAASAKTPARPRAFSRRGGTEYAAKDSHAPAYSASTAGESLHAAAVIPKPATAVAAMI